MAEKDVLKMIFTILEDTTANVVGCSSAADQNNLMTAAFGLVSGICLGAMQMKQKDGE